MAVRFSYSLLNSHFWVSGAVCLHELKSIWKGISFLFRGFSCSDYLGMITCSTHPTWGEMQKLNARKNEKLLMKEEKMDTGEIKFSGLTPL